MNLKFIQPQTYEILGEVLDIGKVSYFIHEAIVSHVMEKDKVKQVKIIIPHESPGTANYLNYSMKNLIAKYYFRLKANHQSHLQDIPFEVLRHSKNHREC